jgi:4-coumarate--CoA ligase
MNKNIIHYSSIKDVEIPEITIHDYIFDKIKNFNQEKEAIIDFETNEKLNFKELKQLSINFSQNLIQSFNAKQYEKIAVFTPNTVYYPIFLYGTSLSGLTLTTINPLYTSNELKKQVSFFF